MSFLKTVTIVGLILSLAPFASSDEGKTFSIKGMHCGGCVDSIKEKVCEGQSYEKCDVNIGFINIVPTSGTDIDEAKVKKQVKSAGHYRVTQVTKLQTKGPALTGNAADPTQCPEAKKSTTDAASCSSPAKNDK
jgi:copper chaperone CopZ